MVGRVGDAKWAALERARAGRPGDCPGRGVQQLATDAVSVGAYEWLLLLLCRESGEARRAGLGSRFFELRYQAYPTR